MHPTLIVLCCAAVLAGSEVSITDFGAKADGATDCTPAIQKAIDAAGKVGGGSILFPAAEKPYLIRKTITITVPDIRIEGAGATLQLADDVVDGDNDHVLLVRGPSAEKPVTGIVLRGLAIDANVWAQPRRIYTGNVNGTAVKKEFMPRGLLIQNAKGALCERISVTRAWVSLAVGEGSVDCEVRDSSITNWHNDAFETGDGARGTRFLRCRASGARNEGNGGQPGTRDGGWEIEDGITDITLEDCVVEGADGRAFHIKNHNRPHINRNVRLLRCTARSPSQLGFWIQGVDWDSNAVGVTLEDCSSDIAGKGSYALQINDGPAQVVVRGGQFASVQLKYPRDVTFIGTRMDSLKVKAEAQHMDGSDPYSSRIILDGAIVRDRPEVEGDKSALVINAMAGQ